MTETKDTSGRAAPDAIEQSEDGAREERAKEPTPVAGKWSGLIPAAIVLGLMAAAILLTYLTD